jgi:N6-L-threonylcarbamoyladenine synthase
MKKNDIIILAIETSCDDTSAAVVQNGYNVKSNVIYSQIKSHEKYGGVVPEIASRDHMDKISIVVEEAILLAGITMQQVDAIAVTFGPGLVGALLVGVSYAKALAYGLKKPLIPVHHIEGHICANFITDKNFCPPFVCLVVSGGHTNIIIVKGYGDYQIVGKTRDDAAGEAYDKVARILGLGYPGGPKIDELAKKGNNKAIDFPRAYLEKGSLDFSFSGLKSSVLNYINKSKMKKEDINIEDIAASFQQALIEVLVNKTIDACKLHKISKVAMAGGVSSNNGLRSLMKQQCDLNGFSLNIQQPIYCTDNAAMIGASAYFKYLNSEININDNLNLNAYPRLDLKALR